jgi:hypothetical protein
LGLKDPEADWVKYADKIKFIISSALNIPCSEYGYRDYLEYEKHIKELDKKKKE